MTTGQSRKPARRETRAGTRRRPTGVRDTECPVCGKRYRGKEGLEQHQKAKHS